MSLRRLLVCTALVGMTLILGGAMLAEGEPAEGATSSFDLAEVTCWDALTLNEEDRNIVLFLLYGYVAGSNDQTIHTGPGIEKVLREAGTFCADNPDVGALEAMRKASK